MNTCSAAPAYPWTQRFLSPKPVHELSGARGHRCDGTSIHGGENADRRYLPRVPRKLLIGGGRRGRTYWGTHASRVPAPHGGRIVSSGYPAEGAGCIRVAALGGSVVWGRSRCMCRSDGTHRSMPWPVPGFHGPQNYFNVDERLDVPKKRLRVAKTDNIVDE